MSNLEVKSRARNVRYVASILNSNVVLCMCRLGCVDRHWKHLLQQPEITELIMKSKKPASTMVRYLYSCTVDVQCVVMHAVADPCTSGGPGRSAMCAIYTCEVYTKYCRENGAIDILSVTS